MSAIDYFNGDTLAAEVWENKYALRNKEGELLEKTPDDMHKRLAKEFARIESTYPNPMSEDEIYNLMKDFKYILPQGSPCFGMGNLYHLSSLSNCFVIGNKADSYGGITYTDAEQAQLSKRRAGVGHDISHLRPAGAFVQNCAKTSTGPVSFMHRFSNTTREVAQAGRRGALMITISIKHPDIEEFIDVKQDLTKVTGANISIRVTDEFMRCVIEDRPFTLQYPVDSKEPIVKKEIDAKKLWKKMIHNVWASAEPGLLFWDTIERESPADCYAEEGFKSTSTNPCVTGDTLVLTDKGYKEVNDLIGKKFIAIVNGNPYEVENGFFETGEKVVYKIITNKGYELHCTLDHPLMCYEDNTLIKKPLAKLCIGDTIQLSNHYTGNYSFDPVFYRFIRNNCHIEAHYDETDYVIKMNKRPYNIMFTTRYVQLELLKVGIVSTIKFGDIYIDKMFEKYMKQIFYIEEKYWGSIEKQLDSSDIKNTEDNITQHIYNDTITEITCIGKEKVYDVTVPTVHEFCANGIRVSNCGEIVLCPYDSCRLLAMNLFSYVDNPFTEQALFNVELFSEHVEKAQRLMDDLVDLEIEKIDAILKKIDEDPEEEEYKYIERNLWKKIKRTAVLGRRTGLGITGEGDMLAALNLRYGSEDANDFAEQVHKTMATHAYASSITLAKERGAFPLYNYHKEVNNAFINRIVNACPNLGILMKTYGRRNIALLTIAPTGTTSLMTQTTSGIEPAFMLGYQRKRKVNPGDVNTDKEIITDEVGDKWIAYTVLHHNFKKYLEVNGKSTDIKIEDLDELIKDSPYYKATSNDIDWESKVKMQGRIQKWVDHSISVTVNVPNETTEDTVDVLYKTAWESGCKGCTIYRDGSRFGVLVSANDKKKEDFPKKRPETLDADVVHFKVYKEKWVAFIGLYNNKPYEIFTGALNDINVPEDVNKGTIVKNADRTYDFIYNKTYSLDGEREYVESTTIYGLSKCFNPEYWNCAMLLSKFMRTNPPVEEIVNLVKSLHLSEHSPIHNWKKGVARALTKYVPSGTKSNKEQCKCGEYYTYQEGCLICHNCGDSRCN